LGLLNSDGGLTQFFISFLNFSNFLRYAYQEHENRDEGLLKLKNCHFSPPLSLVTIFTLTIKRRGGMFKTIIGALLFIGLLIVPSHSGAEIAAPTGVEASQGTFSDAIEISWDPVPGATGYEVWLFNNTDYWCNEPKPCDPKDTIISTIDDPKDTKIAYGFTQTLSDQIYEFHIKAFDDESTSDFSLPAYGYVSPEGREYDWTSYFDIGNIGIPGGGCFIATAAYGSYWESHVMTLRQFRNEHLLTNKLGTKFVEAYYKYSPPIAAYIAEHDGLRSVVRVGLAPLVGFGWIAMNYGMVSALLILIGIGSLMLGVTGVWVRFRET
jgi:hypothetical protein